MKKNLKQGLSLFLLALSLILSSCGKDVIIPVPTGVADNEITMVKVSLSMGHLHGRKNYHFVPSGGKYVHRNIYDIQEFTFVRSGKSWVLRQDAKHPYWDLIAYMTHDYGGGSADAPDYGVKILLFNAKGDTLNTEYTSEANRSHYQFFFYPTEAKRFGGEQVELNPADPTNILKYVYCDTNVWNGSATKSPVGPDGKNLYTFLPDTEPIGIKGYLQFPTISQFNLNITLWHSPKGKLQSGKASPFYAPNDAVKAGRQLLHLKLPISVYADKEDFQDDIVMRMQADYDRRVKEAKEAGKSEDELKKITFLPIPLKDLPSGHQVIARRLMSLLGTQDWESIAMDFYRYFSSYEHNNDPEGYF